MVTEILRDRRTDGRTDRQTSSYFVLLDINEVYICKICTFLPKCFHDIRINLSYIHNKIAATQGEHEIYSVVIFHQKINGNHSLENL